MPFRTLHKFVDPRNRALQNVIPFTAGSTTQINNRKGLELDAIGVLLLERLREVAVQDVPQDVLRGLGLVGDLHIQYAIVLCRKADARNGVRSSLDLLRRTRHTSHDSALFNHAQARHAEHVGQGVHRDTKNPHKLIEFLYSDVCSRISSSPRFPGFNVFS